ncbi:MAG TPA: Hpt domain-containing protein [Burkholderiaceae bacterium]|jgi:HPt (histidine-containing phosphotransfer) domain-containing protein|nr:Hpt domain-containing protein [Burkholderiaceae bacterium]
MTSALLEFPRIDGVDAVHGLRSVGGNSAVYHRLLLVFGDQHEGDAARLAALLAAGRRVDAARLVHKLRGSALVLGVVLIEGEAEKIERGLSRFTQVQCDAAVEALGRSLAAVAASIRRVLSTSGG